MPFAHSYVRWGPCVYTHNRDVKGARFRGESGPARGPVSRRARVSDPYPVPKQGAETLTVRTGAAAVHAEQEVPAAPVVPVVPVVRVAEHQASHHAAASQHRSDR